MKDAPVVMMLWESVDPGKTLTKRFGFRSGAAAADWVAAALESNWELPVDHCDRLTISARNVMAWVMVGDRRLIAKWSAFPSRFAHLGEAARVTTWLASSGIPVAAPLPDLGGRLLVELGNPARGRARAALPLPGSRFLLGVLPVVGGDLLDVGDPAQVRDAGLMLAAVHEALAAYPHQTARARVRPERTQLVHNDFRSANILHDGTSITAVLDLEELKYGTRVADLAKSAVLLGTRYRDWGPTSADARSTFVAAYNDRAPLTSAEREELGERIHADLTAKGWA